MDDISYRLKIIIGEMSERKFSERLGLAHTTVREYLKGRMPPADFIVRVCERCPDIDPWWLMTGQRKVVVAEPPVGYSVLSDLEEMLQRIIKEGDDTKLAAVRGVLAVYDPGGKKY